MDSSRAPVAIRLTYAGDTDDGTDDAL